MDYGKSRSTVRCGAGEISSQIVHQRMVVRIRRERPTTAFLTRERETGV